MMTSDEYREKEEHLLEELPPELRSAVSQMAYESGHSAGYEEVLLEMSDLIYGLKEPLAAFEKRIRAEYAGPKSGFFRPAPAT